MAIDAAMYAIVLPAIGVPPLASPSLMKMKLLPQNTAAPAPYSMPSVSVRRSTSFP